MSTLYELIREDYKQKGLVNIPCLLERLMASLGGHLMNLSNIDNNRFYHANMLENFRTHVVFMAPSGFGKSLAFRMFLDEDIGLLNGSVTTSLEHSFSPESWMGTIDKDVQGNLTLIGGLFHEHKRSIVGCDEFQRLAFIMDEKEGQSHEEAYLMTALDYNHVRKRLAYGAITENNVGLTLWAGMRPHQLNLAAGTARRFSFQMFFPTMNDCKEFKRAARSREIKKPTSVSSKKQIGEEIGKIKGMLLSTEDIDYTSVERWCDSNPMIPHYEEKIYIRLAVGYAVVNEQFKGSLLVVDVDERLERLLADEFQARQIIRADPKKRMILEVIRSAGKIHENVLTDFISNYYQMPKVEVHSIVGNLKFAGKIRCDGEYIIPEESAQPYKIEVVKV